MELIFEEVMLHIVKDIDAYYQLFNRPKGYTERESRDYQLAETEIYERINHQLSQDVYYLYYQEL